MGKVSIGGYVLTGLACMAVPLLGIPTINYVEGNGFKLLISGSAKTGKDKSKNGTANVFTSDERLGFREAVEWLRLEYIRCVHGDTGIYYTQYENSSNGKIGMFAPDSGEGGQHLSVLELIKLCENRGMDSFDFSGRFKDDDRWRTENAEQIWQGVCHGNSHQAGRAKTLKYIYGRLAGLEDKIGFIPPDYVSDHVRVLDDFIKYRRDIAHDDLLIADMELPEELPELK